jgi:ATPase subunit of ABC transporter with duplicated ATPase domains
VSHVILVYRRGAKGASVVFAILAMEHPSVILLDEPTNHLDMVS